MSYAEHFIHSMCKQTGVPHEPLSLKVHVFINNKCIYRHLPVIFLISKFSSFISKLSSNRCHSLLLGIQSVILLSLWHRNVCKLISAFSLVNRRVNHAQYSNTYGALIGGWKNAAVCLLLVFTLVFTIY